MGRRYDADDDIFYFDVPDHAGQYRNKKPLRASYRLYRGRFVDCLRYVGLGSDLRPYLHRGTIKNSMNMSAIFLSVLSWCVSMVLYTPFQILRLAGTQLPPCASWGIVTFSTAVMTSAFNWIRFFWPILQFVPWSFVWNYLSAVILFIFFRWMWGHLPWLISFVFKYWWAVVIFFVIGGVISYFIGSTWTTNNVFTQIFSSSATSTNVNGAIGGGFGGGGGGSF